MTITDRPHFVDLFGINPRWVVISRTNADSHRVQLIFQKEFLPGIYLDVVTLQNYYEAEDEVVFNISKLAKLTYYLPPVAALVGFSKTIIDSQVQGYRVKLCEFDIEGNELDDDNFEAISIRGGRSIIENRRSQFADWIQQKRFLTMQPARKYITRDQPEFLAYYIEEPAEYDFMIHRLGVTLTLSDGSTQSVLIPYVDPPTPGDWSFTAQPEELVLISTGFGQMNLAQFENPDDLKYIVSYSVRINSYSIDGSSNQPQIGTLLYSSETAEYIVQHDQREWESVYIIFQNSVGGLDTICLRGKKEIKSGVNRTIRMTVETRNRQYHEHPYRSGRPNGIKEVKANTGWINHETREWVEDILLSSYVWEVRLNGARDSEFVPVLITSDSVEIHQDDESLQSVTITYEYPQKQAR